MLISTYLTNLTISTPTSPYIKTNEKMRKGKFVYYWNRIVSLTSKSHTKSLPCNKNLRHNCGIRSTGLTSGCALVDRLESYVKHQATKKFFSCKRYLKTEDHNLKQDENLFFSLENEYVFSTFWHAVAYFLLTPEGSVYVP